MSTCYAPQDPMFQPAMRVISAITRDNPSQVTTTFDHDYSTGLIVRLVIPKDVGMPQADLFCGEITVTSPTTFTIPMDSTNFDVFAIPISPLYYQNTCALVVPVGEDSDMINLATRNVL